MADSEREDSWVAGLADDPEKDAAGSDDTEGTPFAIPQRYRRPEMPLRQAMEKKYIRMEDEAKRKARARAPDFTTSVAKPAQEEDESEDEEEEIEELPQREPRQAPVYTKGDRGPNLNRRESRKRLTSQSSAEIDWDLLAANSAFRTGGPSPPRTPPSVGGSPEPPDTPPPRSIFNPTNYEAKTEAADYDEKLKEINKSEWASKPLTKWVEGVVVKKSQRAVYKENTEQVQEGIKVVETLTEPALSKPLSLITTMLPYVVFAISMIVSVIGIVGDEVRRGSYNRGTDYSCFTLDITDLVLLTCNALLHRTAWFKGKSDEEKERFQKRQQLVDNILAEVLLYPSIMCSLIGVTTDRVWTYNFADASSIGHNERLSIIDVILITFDVCSLLYVYVSRMYIVYCFMKNLESMFPDATDQSNRFAITTRIFYTVVLNSLLFGFMIIHLSLQVYHENLPENKPAAHRAKELALGSNVQIIYVSYVAGLLMLCTVILPIFNIVIFILANYYYVIELMVNINLHVVKKAACRKKLEEHGDVAKGIIGFAGKNVHATPGRLRDLQSLTTFQRIFFVLREWWIDIIFAVWATMVIGYCILFFDYYEKHVAISDYVNTSAEQQTFSIIYICSFMICGSLFALGNYHSFVVVAVTLVIMVPLFCSFAVQAIIDKCSAGISRPKEKDRFAGIVTLAAKGDKAGSLTPVPVQVEGTKDPSIWHEKENTMHSNISVVSDHPSDNPKQKAENPDHPSVRSLRVEPAPLQSSDSPQHSAPKSVPPGSKRSTSSVTVSLTNVEQPEDNQ